MQTSLAPLPGADGQLSLLSRRALLGFLLGLALLLVYVLVALWSVDFPDAHSAKPPLLSGPGPAGAGHPWIEQLDPDQVVAGGTQSMLAVYGYNFTPSSKVLLNAVERPARFVSANLLLAPLLSTEIAQPGGVTVTVADGTLSASRRLPVIPAARVFGLLKLRFTEVPINEETRLVLLVLLAGALGSYIHAIKSLVDYIGNQTARESWFWFYVTRPFVGMALALIFYSVIRGGFLAGAPADARSVNPFGVVALAGLVGMFADKASQKLSEVFDAMFRTYDTRKDKLAPLEITTETLPGATVNQPYAYALLVKGGQAGYSWSATGLPQGIHIDPATGALSGKPLVTGDADLVIAVKDLAGATRQKHFRLQVKP